MEDRIQTMHSVSFLSDFSDEELRIVEKCLSLRIQIFEKRDRILEASEPAATMAVILQGRVLEEYTDVFGNRNIVAERHRGDALAIDYACMQMPRLLTTYIAAERSKILFLNSGRIFGDCNKNCNIRSKMLENLLKLTVSELLSQSRKIKCMSQRNTREKLIAFLSYSAQQNGKSSFSISFSRQELADYLCLNRSAVSKELCLMRDEGLLRFHRNHFELLIGDDDRVS